MIKNERRQQLAEKYKNSVEMSVSSIRFTQRSVNDTFSNGAPIKWTIHMLNTKQIKPCEIPLIRVGMYNGYYKSIDNRRLYCYKTCNIKKIPVIIMKTITKEFYCKDQSPNNGVSVKVIHDPKSISHHKNIVTAFHPITRKSRSWTVKQIITDTKTIGNTANKKPNKPKTYFCEICDSTMSWNDKSGHLNGRRHQNEMNAIQPTPSKPQIPTTMYSRQKPKAQDIPKPKPKPSKRNNNAMVWKLAAPKQDKKAKQTQYKRTKMGAHSVQFEAKLNVKRSPTKPPLPTKHDKKYQQKRVPTNVQNVAKPTPSKMNNNTITHKTKQREEKEEEETPYIGFKMVDSVQFEFQEKLSQKTKQIKNLEIELNVEKSIRKSLSVANMKLQQQLLIQSSNDVMMDEMRRTIHHLKHRVSQQELKLNAYQENKELSVVIDVEVNETKANILGLDWFCCCKKRTH